MLGTLYYHFKRFGLAGLQAAFSYRLSGKRTTLTVAHPQINHPVKIRIGTSDAAIFDQVLVNAEYNFNSSSDIKVMVDAGANIGLAAVLFATRYPKAKIYAIEPESSNVELLRENTRPYPNITIIHAALWDTAGTIELVDSGLGHWGFTTREEEKSGTSVVENQNTHTTVAAVTIETLLTDYSIDNIDILKIDIEGAEREVFQKADAWIDQVKAMIVELHDHMKPGCSESFEKVASNYSERWQRGENVYVSKPGIISPA